MIRKSEPLSPSPANTTPTEPPVISVNLDSKTLHTRLPSGAAFQSQTLLTSQKTVAENGENNPDLESLSLDSTIHQNALTNGQLSQPSILQTSGETPGKTLSQPSLFSYCREISQTALLCMFTFLAIFFLCFYFVPTAIEEIEYARAKGIQKAKYEYSQKYLDEQIGTPDLTKLSQAISQKTLPSVVHIRTAVDRQNSQEPLFASGSLSPKMNFHGQGAGFIVDSDGYILTNNHVIDKMQKVYVTLSDGETIPAKVVGRDELTDLAVLKIPGEGYVAAEWGNSEELELGSLVWALGSPFGLSKSITFGIVSGKHRGDFAGSVYQDFLQTDAAVNPGNSGGPLVNERGEVIGVNTAIVGDTYQGVSFSVPSKVAQKIYSELKKSHHIQRGWLGLTLEPLDSKTARKLDYRQPYGMVVTSVVRDKQFPSPASTAGIAINDILVRYNGQPVTSQHAIQLLLSESNIGQVVKLEFFRKGKLYSKEVTLTPRPQAYQ
ncbi:MAG: trypsin-like peptidase domain-containing protein [Pirellulaceae bacterium]|nr:trypsin-like peptidase domain-containing protein [Pirellulaceae bacterium]